MPLVLRHGERHRHRFGGRGALVEQRRVRDRQAGEIAHHGLEVEQRFEPPLRDLRLVRRVGGVPAGILQDVALDHGRDQAVAVAHGRCRSGTPGSGRRVRAWWRASRLRSVLAAAPAARRSRICSGTTASMNASRDSIAEGVEHGLDVVGAGPDVARREFVGRVHCRWVARDSRSWRGRPRHP